MRCGCGFRGCSLRFESKRSPSCRCTANPDVCFLLSLCSVFCPSGSFTNDGVHLLTAILFICTTTTTATVTTAAIIGALPFLPPLLQLSVLVIGRVGAGLPEKPGTSFTEASAAHRWASDICFGGVGHSAKDQQQQLRADCWNCLPPEIPLSAKPRPVVSWEQPVHPRPARGRIHRG